MPWNIKTWSCKFFFSTWISMARSLKNTKAKLDLLTDIDILLMVEKLSEEVKSYHAICQYAKAHNKYIKDYDENKESSYLQY